MSSIGADTSRYQVAALAKGLQVLRAIADAGRPMRLTDLSAASDIPTATLFRLVTTLEHEGLVDRDDDGGYRPAVAVLRLGFASLRASGLVGVATGPIKALSQSLGETVNLGVLNGDRILYLIRNRNRDLVTAHLEVGSSLPATSTSIGKVLLASLTRAELRKLLDEDSFSEGRGPNAPHSIEELDRRLKVVTKQGYAIQDEEVAAGLRSIAAPVFDADHNTIAAINIAVSSNRYSAADLETTLRAAVLDTADEISRCMGA